MEFLYHYHITYSRRIKSPCVPNSESLPQQNIAFPQTCFLTAGAATTYHRSRPLLTHPQCLHCCVAAVTKRHQITKPFSQTSIHLTAAQIHNFVPEYILSLFPSSVCLTMISDVHTSNVKVTDGM